MTQLKIAQIWVIPPQETQLRAIQLSVILLFKIVQKTQIQLRETRLIATQLVEIQLPAQIVLNPVMILTSLPLSRNS